jgi:hypothetical protein
VTNILCNLVYRGELHGIKKAQPALRFHPAVERRAAARAEAKTE